MMKVGPVAAMLKQNSPQCCNAVTLGRSQYTALEQRLLRFVVSQLLEPGDAGLSQ